MRNLCEKEGERNSKSAKESLKEIENEGLTNSKLRKIDNEL